MFDHRLGSIQKEDMNRRNMCDKGLPSQSLQNVQSCYFPSSLNYSRTHLLHLTEAYLRAALPLDLLRTANIVTCMNLWT